MSSVNKVILIGHLGRDPEARYLPSGDAVVNFSIATSERFTDKAGEKQEKTEWHRCVAFGKRGEVIGEHMKKGSQIYVEGKITTKKWTDKEGNERYSTEIVVENFQFLGGKKPEDGESSPPTTRKDYAEASGKKRATEPVGELSDDIPF